MANDPSTRPSARNRTVVTALAVSAALLLSLPAVAQTADNVLVVVNQSSADSVRIGERYASVRNVPPEQVIRLAIEPAEEIDFQAFDRQIQIPIGQWLRRHDAQDRIHYIVLTKGVPLRIRGSSGRTGTVASVDSELALLYRRMTGADSTLVGPTPNPYYLGEAAVAQAKAFSHETQDIYLVTRLDGFTVDDVLALIDRGLQPVAGGRILLDQKASIEDLPGNQWLRQAADWMTANGFGERVELETTSQVVTGKKEVLGYYSWGSNDPAVTARHPDLAFVPGALAASFVSTDARTFHEPAAGWRTGSWNDRSKFHAGSPESLTGDIIRAGVTGVAGHVAEPYLDSAIRPQVLFPAYLSGFNLAEAFYLAMPALSWQTVVIGDPLCRPFARAGLSAEANPGLDPETGLPRRFSARRLRVVLNNGTRLEAALKLVKGEERTAKGDDAAAREAFEAATALDPRIDTAHLVLASFYETSGEYDKAVERYRKVLANDSRNIVALNNLAYALAVRKQQPAEALVYAERAHTLSAGNATVADTLAWVQHLLGRNEEAGRLLGAAVRQEPGNAEIRLHAAVVFAALGMLDAAARELQEALRLDPALEKREDVVALRAKLKAPSPVVISLWRLPRDDG